MNYLLLGFDATLLHKIKKDIELNKDDKAILLTSQLNKSLYEGTLGVYNIDIVITENFEFFKITNSSNDIRYLENYRFLIDICVRNDVKHLHIIENAENLYNGFTKPTRDYKYKEDDDEYSNDLDSLNHLFIKKYAEHITSTTSLTITISRYNQLLVPTYLINTFVSSSKKCQEFEYVEDNKFLSYTALKDASKAILKLCTLNEFGVYNLPTSHIFTTTELLNFTANLLNLDASKLKVQQLRNMPESYVLDDSKIKKIL